MIFRTYFFFILGFSALTTALYLKTLRISPEDRTLFHNRVHQARHQEKLPLFAKGMEQTREGIQKDLWTYPKQHPLLTRIQSTTSRLCLYRENGKLKAKEILFNLHCWRQENFNPLTQIQEIKELKAKQGTYYFPSHIFTSDLVEVLSYEALAPSFTPIGKEPLKALGKNISFSLLEKEEGFSADHLQLLFDGTSK